VLLVLRTRKLALRSVPSKLLVLMSAAVAVVSVGIPYMGPLASLFDFVPLPWYVLGAVMAIVAAYVLSTEAAKVRFFRRLGRGARSDHVYRRRFRKRD
jgi:Mg2+-importing ATPase